jgi:hypothetical protein
VPIAAGAPTTWQVDLANDFECKCGDAVTVTANDFECKCGDAVTVTAFCQLGKPSQVTVGPLALPCEECPTLTIILPWTSTPWLRRISSV